MSPTLIAVLLAIGAGMLVGNLVATIRILRSDFGSWPQQLAQLAFIWLVPIIGAAVAIFMTRTSLPPGTGKYPKAMEEADEVAVSTPDYSSSD